MLRIDLTSLEDGLHWLERRPEAEALGLDPQVFRAVQVQIRLDYREDRVLVDFEAEAVARLTCDRTLRFFDQPVAGQYEVLFAAHGRARPRFGGEDDEPAFEEIRELSSTDRSIDLTDLVRDTLLLALPVRRVAPGEEDAELPTRFGVAEDEAAEIDPRWEALRALQANKENENGAPPNGAS